MPGGASAVAVPRPQAAHPPSAARAILWAWAVAGTLDILSAVVITVLRGGNVERMLKGIASGLLGKAALDGGLAIAGLGLALHYVIALGAVLTFWAASRKLPWLLDHAVVSGLLFGLGVWLFMNVVVLPLSAIHAHFPPPIRSILTQVPIHLVLIGLTIALIVRRFSRAAPAD